MTQAAKHHYKSTESKYKGVTKEMYVTDDLCQETRGDNEALYPKIKRVYIAGDVKNWQIGTFQKRTGKTVHGVKITYEQSREAYAPKGYTAHRGSTEYKVAPAKIEGSTSTFSQIIEVSEDAQNIAFHQVALPERYQEALQDVH